MDKIDNNKEDIDEFVSFKIVAKYNSKINNDNKLKNNNSDSNNLILDNVKDKNRLLVFKICLPKDPNFLALIIPNKSKCKKALIDYLDSQDEVLQPFTISESLNPTKTIDL